MARASSEAGAGVGQRSSCESPAHSSGRLGAYGVVANGNVALTYSPSPEAPVFTV